MIKGSYPFLSNFYSQGFKGLGKVKIAPSTLQPLKFGAEDEPKSPIPPESSSSELPAEKSNDIILFTHKEEFPKDALIKKIPEEPHPATIPFEIVPSPSPAQSIPDIKPPTNEIIKPVFPFPLPLVQTNTTKRFIKSPKSPSNSSTSQFHPDPFSLKLPTSKANESKISKKNDPLKPKMEPLANISSKDPLPPEILSLESAKHFDLFPSKNDITLAKPLYPTFPKHPPTEIIPFNAAKHFKSRLPKELEAIRKGLLNGTLPESEMLEATPNLLLNQPLDVLNKVIRAVEYFFDADKEARGFHPNEAELLLLLNHPALLDRNPKNTAVMTQVLTSITRFIKTPTVQLTDRALKAWANIGVLTHSFRFWRFDTTGDDQSLFAQFGFKPLPMGRPGDAFGKGFLFDDTKAKGGTTGCLFEFRRGYLLASHPEHGTLVIRNSSKVFGRNLMKHPAYLLPGSLNEKQLIAFNPEQLPDGSHILNRNLYLDPVKGAKAKNRNLHDFNNENDLHLSYLTEALLSLKEEYRRFKLDTQAFEGYGSQRVFTGHLSPGFAKIVQKLNQLKQQQQPTSPQLQLAFVHPEFPIYQPYGTYPLTDEHLNELNRFVQGDMTKEDLENADWVKFLSTAGVQNRAELVLITEG